MAQKCLECLVVDGNYSKARIGALLLGLISIAFLIWLIVLTVNLDKDKEAEANATQDFEWDKIAVTCSDKVDNKIDEKLKDDLKKCQDWAKDKNAEFIFYSDDKNCAIYKACDKMEISIKTGKTYQKDKNDESGWSEYYMTCGKDNLSFKEVSMVDSVEKCKEEASKSDHGKFIFFSESSPFPKLNKTMPGCYFYGQCDSTNVHHTDSPGETYQRKLKE